MEIALVSGGNSVTFDFEPERQNWSTGNTCKFLIGHKTGRQYPFDRVFVKRISGRAPAAHKLLLNLLGREIEGTPKVLGYTYDRKSHIYFFENVASDYKLLEEQLETNLIRPVIGRIITKEASAVFREVLQHRYIYTDFCAKNTMLDYAKKRAAFIDLDSAWPITRISKSDQPRPKGLEFKIYFWGLWNNYISWDTPDKPTSVPKTMVLSFAAVWSRAIMLAHHPAKADPPAALNLIRNPGLDNQRALWDALKTQNRQGFMDYFGLSDANARVVYNQWQCMFNDLRRGRELPWEELTGATDNLFTAIEEAQKPQPKLSRQAAAARQATPADPAVQTGYSTSRAPVKPLGAIRSPPPVAVGGGLSTGSAAPQPQPKPGYLKQFLIDVKDGFLKDPTKPPNFFRRWPDGH